MQPSGPSMPEHAFSASTGEHRGAQAKQIVAGAPLVRRCQMSIPFPRQKTILPVIV
jgi:hypothetical protein